jgi:hypothetical protein
MPRSNRKLTRETRKHQRHDRRSYAQARTVVLERASVEQGLRHAERIARRVALGEVDAPEVVAAIQEIAAEHCTSYDDAEAWYDAPENQVMCEDCGWTFAMVCPECAGCGCDHTCSGWRHRDYGQDPEDDDPDPVYYDCPECGGQYEASTGYGCAC